MRIPWLWLSLGLAACGSSTGGGDGAVADLTAAADLTVAVVDLPFPPDMARVPDFAGGGGTSQVACGDTQTCKAPASVCCRASPFGAGKCVMPGDGCGEQKYACDDPSDCPAAQVCCHPPSGGSACTSASECTAMQGQRMCLMTSDCATGEMCCGVGPSPSWYCSMNCPVSKRAYKRDIRYLDNAEKHRLAESLLGFPLATYQYRHEGEAAAPRLGFIIDDVQPSPAIDPSGERVDVYAYTTMAVAALQEQAREIAALKEEIARLKKEMVPSRRSRLHR